MSDSGSSPTSPDKRDDEMDPEQYEYPPGLMPSTDAEYDWYLLNDAVTIYEVGRLKETRVYCDEYTEVML